MLKNVFGLRYYLEVSLLNTSGDLRIAEQLKSYFESNLPV